MAPIPNPSVKRDCGTVVAGFLNRLRAAAVYFQRWASDFVTSCRGHHL